MLLIRDVDSILTLDAGRRILERHSVLIEGGKIVRVGDTATLDRDHLDTVRSSGKVVEGAGCMMLAAYVNTHVHTVEHLSRGLIPDDLARSTGPAATPHRSARRSPRTRRTSALVWRAWK